MEELIDKAKKGDEQAFTRLIMLFQQDLYKIALTRLHEEYDIDEALQETMISAYKNLKKIRNPDKFKSWLIKILINKCNDIYKIKKIKLMTSIEEINTFEVEEKNTKEVESNLNFYSIINMLEPKEKKILVLFYCENYTTREIGRILNIKENTIKTILHRAKKKLKNKYKGTIDT